MMRIYICDSYLCATVWGTAIGYYASPSSGDAYSNQQLTSNFELWVGIFLCADMFPYDDSKTMSVRLFVTREKKTPYLCQYQSYVSNW